MPSDRTVKTATHSTPTMEGAGVFLKRAFGFSETPNLDPFLLLDDFRSDDPSRYSSGFPWHPHRGIETITYILHGTVEHGDSLGNKGVIGPGDVQWMTAGSGIIHQEMPQGDEQGRMHGFQLWANLPAAHKMMAPRYREARSDQIPVVSLEHGVTVRVICGEVAGTRGPIGDVVIEPQYLDVTVPAGAEFVHPTPAGHTVVAYVIGGTAAFGDRGGLGNETLVVLSDGARIVATGDGEAARFLLLAGRPIREPIAWRGPIVMNTAEELQIAFTEYRNGTFIKHPV